MQYERTGEVPTYERAVNRPLKLQQRQQPTLATTFSSLPNGNNKPSEGGILADPETTNSVIAFPGITSSDRAFISAGGSSVGSKRQRSSQRCFNCGSYAHSLRECWKKHDPEAIQDARRRLQGVAGAGGGNGGPPRRYFSLEEEKVKQKRKKERRQEDRSRNDGSMSSSGSEEEDGELEESVDEEELTPFERLCREFPVVAPGLLSTSLREALGIGALDAPPWLHAMRAMGLPPAYKPRPEAKGVDIIKKEQQQQEEEKEKEAPPPPPPPPLLEQEEKGEVGLLLPVIEDRIGVSTTIAIHLAAAQGRDNEAIDFIQLHREKDFKKGNDDGGKEEEEDGRGDTIYRKEVTFPGINAPIPEGADPVQWGDRGSGGGGGGYYQQQQQPPPQQQQQQIPVPMYSAVLSHEYYAQQHSYHEQEWHQHHRHEYYTPRAAAAAAAAAAAYQIDHYGHYHHHQQQQQQAPPLPAGDYYHHHPPVSSPVLPYQPPPPQTQQPPQFSSPALSPPPPPPSRPSDAGHYR